MNKRLLFFSEDQPGATSAGFRARFYRAYSSLVDRAILSEIRARQPGVSVVSERLKEAIDAPGLVSANYVTTLGFSKANVDPLIAFQRMLLRILEKRARSRIQLESTLNRSVLANLLEHLARPIGAYGAFFAEQSGVSELLLLEKVSPHGRIAAKVAAKLGWKVRVSAWSILLAPLAWLKKTYKQRKDGLPTPAWFASQYRSEPAPASHPDFLFFCVDERRIRRLSATAKKLADRGVSAGFAVYNVKAETTRATEELRRDSIPFATVNHFLPAPVKNADEEFSSELARWDSAFLEARGQPENDLAGISIADFCRDQLLSQCAKIAFEAGLFEAAARNYLSKARPRVIFFADVGLHSMVLARVCEELGIETIFYVYNPLLFTVPYWRGVLFENLRTTRVFTGTRAMAEAYVKHGGYPPGDVKVIGDVFATAPAPAAIARDREGLREHLGLAPGEKIVLALSFFVSGDISLTQKRQFFRTVAESVGDAKLVVKAHPNESEPALAAMLAELGIKPALLTQNDDLRALLHASDAVCMVFSQAGMEVVLAGVPLLMVQSEEMRRGFEAWVPYVGEGAAASCADATELRRELKAMLFDEQARARRLEKAAAFREKYISPIGTDPTEAMIAAISEALADRRTPGSGSPRA